MPSNLNGGPDGAQTDAEGFIWACLSGAGRVVRIAPDTGAVDTIVELPVSVCVVLPSSECLPSSGNFDDASLLPCIPFRSPARRAARSAARHSTRSSSPPAGLTAEACSRSSSRRASRATWSPSLAQPLFLAADRSSRRWQRTCREGRCGCPAWVRRALRHPLRGSAPSAATRTRRSPRGSAASAGRPGGREVCTSLIDYLTFVLRVVVKMWLLMRICLASE